MMINNNCIVFTCFYPHQTPKKMMLTNPESAESGHLSYCSIDHCGTAGDCAKCSWIVPKTSAGLDSPSYSRWMYTNAWLTSWTDPTTTWREWFNLTRWRLPMSRISPSFRRPVTSLDLWPCDPKSGKLCIPAGGNDSHFYCRIDLLVDPPQQIPPRTETHIWDHCSVVSQLKKVSSQKN